MAADEGERGVGGVRTGQDPWAMRLLNSGVDTTVIALWLGHEQIGSTNIYGPRT
jgi:hypothetical protein